MARPLIGITTACTRNKTDNLRFSVPTSYARALSQSGACPVLIPLGLAEVALRDLLGRLDGVLFPGGGDIHPERYGSESQAEVTEIDTDRDRVEFYLLEHVIRDGMPFLGICRGLQVVNVGLGGTLYADITSQNPRAAKHDYYPGWQRDYLAHEVYVAENSLLGRILDVSRVKVNSLHHQAVLHLASGLRATAHAPDGLVEAVELPNHPFGLAVQWHPECLTAHTSMRALFRTFVRAADEQGS